MTDPARNGAKTSEGWLAIGTFVAGLGMVIAGAVVPNPVLLSIGGGLLGINTAAYTAGRSAVKRKAIEAARPRGSVPDALGPLGSLIGELIGAPPPAPEDPGEWGGGL